MKLFGRILAVYLTSASWASSQERSKPDEIDYETAHLSRIAAAVRVREKITVDGRLDEPAWALATPVANFIQRRPRNG